MWKKDKPLLALWMMAALMLTVCFGVSAKGTVGGDSEGYAGISAVTEDFCSDSDNGPGSDSGFVPASAPKLHTVTFMYGTKCFAEPVYHGGIAIPPTDTYMVGYTFVGWVGNLYNVTEDRIILGAYAVKQLDGNHPPATEDSLVFEPGITISENQMYLVKGQICSLPGKTLSGNALKWTSSDNKVLKVSSKLKMTANKGTGSGSPVELKNDQTDDRFLVYVADPVMSEVITDDGGKRQTRPVKKLPLVTGDTAELCLDGIDIAAPGDFEPFKVVWTSDSPSVVNVFEGKVYAFSKGSAKVTAFVNGRTYTCSVTVSDTAKQSGKDAKTIVLKPLQRVKLSYSNGFRIRNAEVSAVPEFRTVNKKKGSNVDFYQNNVVRVDASGNITAVGAGETVVKFSLNGETRSVSVHVDEPVQDVAYVNTGGIVSVKHYNVKAGNADWSIDGDKAHVITPAKAKGKFFAGNTVGTDLIRCTYDPYRIEGVEGTGFNYYTTVFVEDPGLEAVYGSLIMKKNSKINGSMSMLTGGFDYLLVNEVYQPVYFASSNPFVACVDGEGVFRARNSGKTLLSAKVNGKKVSVTVTVQ